MQEQQDYITPLLSEFNAKIVDLEEKQRLLKDRVLLIGENLIEFRDEIERDIGEIRGFEEKTKQDILKIKQTLERILDELEGKARISDIEIVRKQFKMFEPLKLARIEDVEKMIKKEKNGADR